jgi:2-polyprenyl-6-methoxyphenol hydroxylase-like FAD-dependent oxidoreductase
MLMMTLMLMLILMLMVFSKHPHLFIDRVGYDYRMVARPRLQELLHSKIPAKNIHFNKKIVSIEQTEKGVIVHCADGTSYPGDILVGADGASSAVRQSLYKQLQDQNILPVADAEVINKGFSCLVGTTNPLDPKKYPLVKEGRSDFYQIIGEGTPYSVRWCRYVMFRIHFYLPSRA